MPRESITARTGSLRAAAARIGVSLPTLYKLIDSGKLRTYHVGRAHRASEEAVRDCIALLEQEGRANSRPTSPRDRKNKTLAAQTGPES
jgi:excisionase family DNA binding protein